MNLTYAMIFPTIMMLPTIISAVIINQSLFSAIYKYTLIFISSDFLRHIIARDAETSGCAFYRFAFPAKKSQE
jgi:hypothetical protein